MMQEVRHDGSERLTPNATAEMLNRALRDKNNASVAMHKPGATFRSEGYQCRVLTSGEIERVEVARRQKARRKGRRRQQRASRRAGRR